MWIFYQTEFLPILHQHMQIVIKTLVERGSRSHLTISWPNIALLLIMSINTCILLLRHINVRTKIVHENIVYCSSTSCSKKNDKVTIQINKKLSQPIQVKYLYKYPPYIQKLNHIQTLIQSFSQSCIYISLQIPTKQYHILAENNMFTTEEEEKK